ncbi:TetR/AcrR family transcriptional regulator C-terminal domain-containing protein [Nonomuraea sp. NPDC002799]
MNTRNPARAARRQNSSWAWSATLMGRPMLGPNVLARTEFLHTTLQRAGLKDAPLTAAAYGLSHFVIGATDVGGVVRRTGTAGGVLVYRGVVRVIDRFEAISVCHEVSLPRGAGHLVNVRHLGECGSLL